MKQVVSTPALSSSRHPPAGSRPWRSTSRRNGSFSTNNADLWPALFVVTLPQQSQLPLPVTSRRCFTELASVSRIDTESSQPMQASVTDWP